MFFYFRRCRKDRSPKVKEHPRVLTVCVPESRSQGTGDRPPKTGWPVLSKPISQQRSTPDMSLGVTQKVVTAAALLAIRGSYRPALTLLDALEAGTEDSQSLLTTYLLRAKILAQQGRYEDAI